MMGYGPQKRKWDAVVSELGEDSGKDIQGSERATRISERGS